MKKHWTEHTRNLDGPIMTPSRRILLDVLADGPVIDDRGIATPRLHALMTERGYAGQVYAVTNLLRDAEIDGLVERVVRGKRTYAISSRYVQSEPEIDLTEDIDLEASDPEPEPVGVDLEALAAAVLDRALSARAEVAKAEETALEALLRADEAEKRLADTGALEATRKALRDSDEARCGLAAALEAERMRAGQAEDAANTFRTRCAELDEQVGKLRKALKATEAELHEKNANGGYPLKSISPESHAELDRLMKQIPSRRG